MLDKEQYDQRISSQHLPTAPVGSGTQKSTRGNDHLIDASVSAPALLRFIPDFCLPDDDPDLFKLTMSEVFPSRQLVVGYNDKLPISESGKYFIESLNEDK